MDEEEPVDEEEPGNFDGGTCDYCGATRGDDWTRLEVVRPQPEDPTSELAFDYVDLLFCTVDHAGLYLLKGRLPQVAPPTVPEPYTWRDRALGWLIGIAVVATVLWSLFIFGIGAWTFIRHVRGS